MFADIIILDQKLSLNALPTAANLLKRRNWSLSERLFANYGAVRCVLIVSVYSALYLSGP